SFFTLSTGDLSRSPEAPYQFLDVALDRTRLSVPAPTIELWDRRLELMHHYSLVTANTFSIRPEMQRVWRITIPEIGYSFPFVMQGILAVAAVHKAYLTPLERAAYLDLAISHQNAGLEWFRAGLHTINEDNWKRFFCFASLVVLYVASVPLCVHKQQPETEPEFLGSLCLCGGYGRSSNRTRRSSVARTWRPWPPLLRPSTPAVQLRV
ncbi:hypothetical protein FOXB_07938, partial [Fusarium oxysporum f. sp. conglutinans Fo5176]